MIKNSFYKKLNIPVFNIYETTANSEEKSYQVLEISSYANIFDANRLTSSVMGALGGLNST